jgi:hypothetical protein
MPQVINFKALADEILAVVRTNPKMVETIVEDYLRKVWNVRGAADIATVEQHLSTAMGATAAGPYTKILDRELRKLDR